MDYRFKPVKIYTLEELFEMCEKDTCGNQSEFGRQIGRSRELVNRVFLGKQPITLRFSKCIDAYVARRDEYYRKQKIDKWINRDTEAEAAKKPVSPKTRKKTKKKPKQ